MITATAPTPTYISDSAESQTSTTIFFLLPPSNGTEKAMQVPPGIV